MLSAFLSLSQSELPCRLDLLPENRATEFVRCLVSGLHPNFGPPVRLVARGLNLPRSKPVGFVLGGRMVV
jgi:hypothetical protein